MKIAVTSSGPTLESQVEARFGRCAYFLIIETDTLEFEAIENPNLALGGGAGIQSAQLLSEKGVSTILTGNCGPNAFQVFGQAGIRVIVGVGGLVSQAVEQFKSGNLSAASGPNVATHFGMGGGGRGGGMGRGMGRGRGMAGWMGSSPAAGPASQVPSQELAGELDELKEQARLLERQKQQLDQRIQQLESGSTSKDNDV